jgi:hypothetical protein
MKVSVLIFLLSLLTIAHAYEYQSTCACPSWDGSYPDTSYIPSQSSGFQLSESTEVINGVDYGLLISFANRIWLSNDVLSYRGTTLPVKSDCPAGYRIPTGDELRDLLSAVNSAYSTDPKGFLVNNFKMNENYTYLSSEKTFPNITNGGNNDAWRFTALVFKNKLTPSLDTPATYWIPSVLRAKCVLETSASAPGPKFIAS